MPRYYLDVHENQEFYRDADGHEFKDDTAAMEGAVRRMAAVLGAVAAVGTGTRLVVVVARRDGETEPFAAISSRITSFNKSPPQH